MPRQGSHLSCTPDLSQPFSAHEQVCYKEAALLRRLRHPSIVELEAIFQSDGRFYLQLPWYANGTLDDIPGSRARYYNVARGGVSQMNGL